MNKDNVPVSSRRLSTEPRFYPNPKCQFIKLYKFNKLEIIILESCFLKLEGHKQ